MLVQSESKQENQENIEERKLINSVAIYADVLEFDFEKFGKRQKFDVILMDPPWELAGSNPSRGVALSYKQLADATIQGLPLHFVQDRGLLFLWVINSKYYEGIRLLRHWGYKFIEEIVWVKLTNKMNLAKCHGYYLQHAKETCLVGMRGDFQFDRERLKNVIIAQRREQSQKPNELYEIIEKGIIYARIGQQLETNWIPLLNKTKMMYLEDYLDTIEALPLDLQRNLTLLRELDSKSQDFYKEFDCLKSNLIGGKEKERQKIIQEMTELFKKNISHEEEKVALANQTYEIVDKHVRRLDDDLANFNMELLEMPVVEKKMKRKAEPLSQTSAFESSRKRERRSTRAVSIDAGKHSEMSYSDNGSIPGANILPVDPNEPTYCYCGQVSFGEMIGCDNEGCEIEWFHYDCVGLKNPPKGKWYCNDCTSKRKKGLIK